MARRERSFFFNNKTGELKSRGKTLVDATDSDNMAQTKGSRAGNPVALIAEGDDTNIDIRITPKGSGNVEILAPLEILTGKRILDSAGTNVEFGDNIEMNSNKITGLGTPTANTDASTKAYVDTTVGDYLPLTGGTISSNLTVSGNFTVNGTTTTINTSTLSVADNLIDLNSDVTSGTPSQDAGIRILRGDSNAVQLRWNETNDKWELTTDGASYTNIAVTSDIPTAVSELTNDSGYITSYTVTEGDVTAHQAALRITESQINDLGTYLTASDITGKLNLSGGTMSGAIAMGTNKITGMGDPTANQDAATKAYVDSQVSSVPTGDITSVTASTGLTGGGTTGDVTLSIDSTVATLTGTQTLTNKTLGATTVAGNIIPDSDSAYDLGSSSLKFRDLYLSGSSLNLDAFSIETHASGITFNHSSNTTLLPVGGGAHTVVTLAGTETLTNKTLTAPVISSITNTGTLTLPTSTGTVALTSDIPTNNNQLTNGAGYITDYTVTESDVTTHQAALSITESQISDLGAYATLASPTLTGTPAAPTATAGTNTTQIATTAFVSTAVANIVDSAPAALDTLNELAAALGDDANFATTTATSLGEKLVKASNLSDLTDASAARTNLGLGTAATTAATAYATAAQGSTADSATQPGDNVSTLTNDSGYITASTTDTLTNKTLTSPQVNTNIDLLAQADLRFYDADSSNYVGFQAPATATGNILWTLPGSDGTEGQVLGTNGGGTLTWEDPGSGGGSGSSYPNSTFSTVPGTNGDFDMSYNVGQTTQETPFEAGGTDAFGVNLGSVFSLMDPIGSLESIDYGDSEAYVGA